MKIAVKNMVKSYGKETVLDNVTVSFEMGKIHGIIGRNGSGKSMLFKCIAGFVYIDSGEILVDGMRIGHDCDFAPDMGIIIEKPGFLPFYNAEKNLEILAAPRKLIGKKEITEVIKRVGLSEAGRKKVGKYSLGMNQRLGIAQAIMENPSLLLLDEPMNGLDNQGVDDVRELLKQLRLEGKTILLASHSTEDIALLCDTVHEMDKGRIMRIS